MRAHIPDGEGIHAVEMRDEVYAPFDVGAQHHLGVTAGFKSVPACLQLAAKFAEVVDLATVGDGRHFTAVALSCRHGLAAAFQVDDRQAPMAQADRPVDPDAFRIRATQGHGVRHALQDFALCFHVMAEGQPTSDSTHSCLLVFPG
ncbi:hypothetical protein D9M69_526210 [compost metagenome]